MRELSVSMYVKPIYGFPLKVDAERNVVDGTSPADPVTNHSPTIATSETAVCTVIRAPDCRTRSILMNPFFDESGKGTLSDPLMTSSLASKPTRNMTLKFG